jgi:site-specific DNA recombinase
VIVAEFFDAGESRTVAWPGRPRAAALAAQLAGPGRGWDAIVIGEYERVKQDDGRLVTIGQPLTAGLV